MTVKTLFEIPTRGDAMTQPGGIALRYRLDGEYIVHNYNTDRETGTERHYFQGSYITGANPQDGFSKALTELTRRVARCTSYDTGGSLDLAKLLGIPEVPGLVDVTGTADMMDAMKD